MLKAQPWHYRRDGVIFAEFDGKGDPTEVDLGVMSIWAQVRDVPFELKIESMGRMLGDQLGEVLEVSHRNHIIVEKFPRVRIEILLHDPLKTSVGFTPLGSSKQLKFDVRYEKLPLYCECCGLVGHTSERFCNIPSEKRVHTYPKNLSVEDYWKSQGTSKRALKFGSFPRGETSLKEGTEGKISDGIVVKVTMAVRGLLVADKAPAPPAKMDASTEAMVVAPNKASPALVGAKSSTQADPKFGQEGRAGGGGEPSLNMSAVVVGHLERHLTQSVPYGLGQEGVDQLERCSAGIGYSGQDPKLDDVANKQLLFQPGVLEALSGAVAARLTLTREGNGNANLCFRFNANKNTTQSLQRKKGKKDRKYREVNRGGRHVLRSWVTKGNFLLMSNVLVAR
ncbi:hypothetical protein D1007_30150 [Hordeum vulgare]|nr:hypothetical protein D1007_30150 [Hordeum vulgare]